MIEEDVGFTENTEVKIRKGFYFTRHHSKCIGNCGYCKQLRAENPGKTDDQIREMEREPESLFAWDNPSVIV